MELEAGGHTYYVRPVSHMRVTYPNLFLLRVPCPSALRWMLLKHLAHVIAHFCRCCYILEEIVPSCDDCMFPVVVTVWPGRGL